MPPLKKWAFQLKIFQLGVHKIYFLTYPQLSQQASRSKREDLMVQVVLDFYSLLVFPAGYVTDAALFKLILTRYIGKILMLVTCMLSTSTGGVRRVGLIVTNVDC